MKSKSSFPVFETIYRFRRITLALSLLGLAFAQPALGWENLLKDPGFESYELDPRGFYKPTKDAAWQEITLGQSSVRFNAHQWKAPAEMLRERPLGFTPGTVGFEGMGPEENSGAIILQQDILDPRLAEAKLYEAWVWLGGAGNDDDNGPDTHDEVGGWDIFFYDNVDTATWLEDTALQHHRMFKDFWGERGSFVRVSGFGKIPPGTKGARIRVWASTWSTASKPKAYDTQVALDNAHFALIGADNMLVNGDFEMDVIPAEFKGWQRPAAWPFPRNGLEPLDINDVHAGHFDHSIYLPFYGGKYAYGYTVYLNGWRQDAFTFSQFVDYDLPEGTPLMLTYNWIQGAAYGRDAELRIIGSHIEIVAEFLRGKERLGAKGFYAAWPLPKSPANVCRYDQNTGQPYNPRYRLEPPPGTDRIGVHVNFVVHAPYMDGWQHFTSAVDDFFLAPEELPKGTTAKAIATAPTNE